MTYKELKNRETFKKAKRVKYVDMSNKEVHDPKVIQIAPVVYFQRVQENMLLVKLSVYDSAPEGFRRLYGTITAPVGYQWVYNGKSLFGGNRRRALVKTK